MGLEVLAQQSLAAAAVETLTAELRVVGTYSVAGQEVLNVLSNGGYDADGLVAWGVLEMLEGRESAVVRTWDEGELGWIVSC